MRGRIWLFLIAALILAGVGVLLVILLPNEPPTAKILAPKDGTELVSKEVAFQGEGTDPEGKELSFKWDFGDGNTSTEQNPTHVYEKGGDYTITLTVTDPGDASATDRIKIYINIEPKAEAVAKLEEVDEEELILKFISGEAPLTVEFDASKSTDPDGEITSYLWDFGDGTTSSEMITSHTYQEPGEYTVTLTVTDDKGVTHQDEIKVRVEVKVEAIIPTVDGQIADQEYAHHYHDEATGMDLYWTKVEDTIYIALRSPGKGWAGIGFLVEKVEVMKGADIVIGYFAEDLFIEDHYADQPYIHSKDVDLGGTDDILESAGGEIEATVIEFSRKLTAADQYDVALPEGFINVFLAYADADDFTSPHVAKSEISVNFHTGEVKKGK
jgi:PKD repeat protein